MAKPTIAVRSLKKKVEVAKGPNRPLTLNLIPKTMWGKNVRAVVSQSKPAVWAACSDLTGLG